MGIADEERRMIDRSTQDVRISAIDRLKTPAELASLCPIPEECAARIRGYRKTVNSIIKGEDERLLAIIGPCSIHDPKAAIEYAHRLKELAEKVSDTFFVVMRTYFEKPRTALGWRGLIVDPDMDGSYDLSRSFMIGDRLTDMMLAKALGAKGIWYTESKENVPEDLKDTVAIKTDSWLSIASFLTCDGVKEHRRSSVRRTTVETDISISVDLDGTGVGHIHTGIGFFDHMLDQVVKHSRCDISGEVKGDTEVDEHHSAEDTALALGSAFLSALGDKRGIERYGFEIVMMDDVAATVAVDFSGRDELIYDVEFTMDYVGSFPTELIRHFFRSFSSAARCNIYISATKGGNSHHTAEAIFKAFARALRKAVRRIPGDDSISSTKGVL